MYAYQSSALTTAFYTSTSLLGTGSAAFPAINPALYPGLALSVDIQPGYLPAKVNARFAVQMDGGDWFVAVNALPGTGNRGTFVTYSNVFNPNAAAWDLLSVSGNGTGGSAAIGGPASSNLTGNITGAGLVFVHTGAGGTFNFDNFKVTATNVGGITVSSVTNGAIGLGWNAALNVRLQCATNPGGPWTNVPGTAGQAATTAPVNGTSMFYRAAAFFLGGLQDGDFESGNLSANWQVAGTIATASAAAAGAFSGTYSLLQSNSRPYQVQTFQLVTNLANGFYKLTAMVQNSGGQNYCYIGGNDRMTSLPVSSSWAPTVVRGINVTNGQCLVSIQSSDGTGGDWCKVDLVQLNKDDAPYQLLKGGDISELTYVEQGGGVFHETNGVPMDCLDVLTHHGCNIVRLRLYNDPGNPNYSPSNLLPPGIQSPTNILALAKRAKAKGLKD